MGLSRRNFLKILAALPAVSLVPKVVPAFASPAELKLAEPPKRVSEIPSPDTRTSDKKLQLRFEDVIIDCLTLGNIPRMPHSYESLYLPGVYQPAPMYSYLSLSTDYFSSADYAKAAAFANKWMQECCNSSKHTFRPGEIYYEEELIARLDYMWIRSLESSMYFGPSSRMKLDLTFGYQNLEMVNG